MAPISVAPAQLDEDGRTSSQKDGGRLSQSTGLNWERLRSKLKLYGTAGLASLTLGRFYNRSRSNVNSLQSSPNSRAGVNLVELAQAKTSILSLPVEIIEVIADHLRYFPTEPEPRPARPNPPLQLPPITLDLSRFSRVCKYLRWSVEPILYRDLHVDFSGWITPHHLLPPFRPPCRLDLLLRTLAARSDLHGYVKFVRLEWPDDDIEISLDADPVRIQREFLQFFDYCKRVETLLILSVPLEFFSEGSGLPEVKTVVMGSFPDALRALAATFPRLQTVHLDMDDMDAFPDSSFQHQIKGLHLYVQAPYLMLSFAQALEVCGNVTEELHISAEGSGFHEMLPPMSLTLSPLAGANLRCLRLHGEGYNILGHPSSDFAHVVGNLRSLRHLHMSQPRTIDLTAFSILPPSLRSLHLSNYGAWLGPVASRHTFVLDLSKCLQRSEVTAVVKSVATHGLTQASVAQNALGDLSPLNEVCKERGIPFSLNIDELPQYRMTMGQLAELTPEIRILCTSFFHGERAFGSDCVFPVA
jgi:hypothetical protein